MKYFFFLFFFLTSHSVYGLTEKEEIIEIISHRMFYYMSWAEKEDEDVKALFWIAKRDALLDLIVEIDEKIPE